MKRSVLLFSILLTFTIFTFFNSNTVIAEVDELQLEEYLATISWTKQELVEYLMFYDLSLEQMDSLEELSGYLGTPINNENLNDLLGEYEMDYDDLEKLLAEYGETIDDYKFIEDLQLDIEFYLNHDDQFSIASDFLSLFGLTEDELENLYDHFSKQDGQLVEKSLIGISDSLITLSYLRGDEQISLEEQQTLFSIWNQFLQNLNIKATFYLVNNGLQSEVSFNDLLLLEEYSDNHLLMFLKDQEGDVLANISYSPEMLDTHLIYDSLEQMVEVAGLAEEHRNQLQVAKLPKTAGNYVFNIILSLFVILNCLFFLKGIRGRVIS